jgi:dihydrofolate reductase
MGKLVVGTFVTVDGVMQAPGGPDEDREGGFEHGGWSVGYWDEMMGEIIQGQTLQGEALLLGRKTYEIFAGSWPKVSDEDPVAAKLNGLPKYVASRTLTTVDWQNSTLIKGDVAQEVARLKDQIAGEIAVTGSGDLIQTLLRADLVDEYRLWIFPLVLGSGKRLFASGTLPGNLKLTGSTTSGTGVTIQSYERAGPVHYGTFEVAEHGVTSELWT